MNVEKVIPELFCNSGQNIWRKVKRYNKIGQGFKNKISNFVCF